VVCDMSPVIAHERWPEPRPQSCAYLCGPWPLTAHRAPRTAVDATARDLAMARETRVEQFARVGHTLLRSGTTLYTPPGSRDAWDAQYVRANVEPWDLAELPLPGADAVRLEANDTGLANLALAGT